MAKRRSLPDKPKHPGYSAGTGTRAYTLDQCGHMYLSTIPVDKLLSGYKKRQGYYCPSCRVRRKSITPIQPR